jgi:hypothetical protein
MSYPASGNRHVGRKSQGYPTIEEVVSDPSSAENVEANQAGFEQSQNTTTEGEVMSACTGPDSQWAHAIAYGEGGSEVAKMMPEGWGAEGETRSGTIHTNATEGLWLPLYIPEGCDGHLGAIDPDTKEVLPEVVFYASQSVKGILDNLGEVHSSPEVDAARFLKAVEMANEASQSTGSPYVREAK